MRVRMGAVIAAVVAVGVTGCGASGNAAQEPNSCEVDGVLGPGDTDLVYPVLGPVRSIGQVGQLDGNVGTTLVAPYGAPVYAIATGDLSGSAEVMTLVPDGKEELAMTYAYVLPNSESLPRHVVAGETIGSVGVHGGILLQMPELGDRSVMLVLANNCAREHRPADGRK